MQPRLVRAEQGKGRRDGRRRVRQGHLAAQHQLARRRGRVAARRQGHGAQRRHAGGTHRQGRIEPIQDGQAIVVSAGKKGRALGQAGLADAVGGGEGEDQLVGRFRPRPLAQHLFLVKVEQAAGKAVDAVLGVAEQLGKGIPQPRLGRMPPVEQGGRQGRHGGIALLLQGQQQAGEEFFQQCQQFVQPAAALGFALQPRLGRLAAEMPGQARGRFQQRPGRAPRGHFGQRRQQPPMGHAGAARDGQQARRAAAQVLPQPQPLFHADHVAQGVEQQVDLPLDVG